MNNKKHFKALENADSTCQCNRRVDSEKYLNQIIETNKAFQLYTFSLKNRE